MVRCIVKAGLGVTRDCAIAVRLQGAQNVITDLAPARPTKAGQPYWSPVMKIPRGLRRALLLLIGSIGLCQFIAQTWLLARVVEAPPIQRTGASEQNGSSAAPTRETSDVADATAHASPSSAAHASATSHAQHQRAAAAVKPRPRTEAPRNATAAAAARVAATKLAAALRAENREAARHRLNLSAAWIKVSALQQAPNIIRRSSTHATAVASTGPGLSPRHLINATSLLRRPLPSSHSPLNASIALAHAAKHASPMQATANATATAAATSSAKFAAAPVSISIGGGAASGAASDLRLAAELR